MDKTRKSNLLFVLAMALIAVFSCFFGAFTLTGNKKISASAATSDITDTLTLGDWGAPETEPDIRYIWFNDYGGIPTSIYTEYWNDNGPANAEKNGGIDIMEYIYIDGESARSIVTKNQKGETNFAGTQTAPLTYGGVFAPIGVFSNVSGVGLKVLLTYKTSFVLTVKAGFQIVDSNGTTYTVSKDVDFQMNEGRGFTKVAKYTLAFEGLTETKRISAGTSIGELPAIPEREGYFGEWQIDGKTVTEDTVYTYGADKTATPFYYSAKDITNTIALENRQWGALSGEYYFGVLNSGSLLNTADNISNCWYLGNGLVANNNGIDITEYIYVNGKSAKQWITENNQLSSPLVGEGNATTPWLGNSAASPVCIRTSTAVGNMGIMINILKAAVSEPFTLTLKKGFSVIDSTGERLVVSEDVNYTYNAGVLSQEKYALSFGGLEETKRIVAGAAIGELPAVPERDGCVGVWQIDGVEIKAETVYNYGVNKTATAVYYEGTDIIDTLDMANWGTVAGNDCTYIRVGNYTDKDGNLMMPTAFENIHWQDGYALQTKNNFGCDLMEYIYINGKSARSISTENGQNGTYGGEGKATTFPFTIGGIYAPIDVYTNGNEFLILIMTDYVAKDNLVVTLKAGFRMATSDNGMLYLSEDFVFPYYTVTFDGEAKKVAPNATVTEPVAPTKEETESHIYTFDGWYNGETKWDFDDPVTENLTLTAKFIETEKAKFTVTYNAENGTQNIEASVYTGASLKADQIPADPEKAADGTTAYTFLYWSLDGKNAYDFSAPVTENITLTAVYTTKALYTVTVGNDTVKVVEGGKVAQPADPTKESTAEYDYIFDGWYNGDVKWDFENNTVTSDLTLVAKFTESKRSYTVTFNVTGNDNVTLAPDTVEYGTTYDLTNLLDGVDVSAYTYTITVDGVAVTSVNVVSNVTVDVAFTARVYYTVTVDGVEQTVEEGAKATKPTVEPTKESTAEYDYTFDGWYNGETKWDFENDVVNADLELVAKYTETKRKYTVTFNVTGNNAIKLDPVEVEYGTNYDLSKLLDGKDVSGYTYSISVGGVEKTSIKVIGDTTVTVAFTKKADNNGSASSLMGCMGTISGMGAVLGVMALGVVAVMKKKED